MLSVSITALSGLLLCAMMALAACGQIPSAPAAATQVDAIGTPPTSSIYIGNNFFYFNNGMTSNVGPLRARRAASTIAVDKSVPMICQDRLSASRPSRSAISIAAL